MQGFCPDVLILLSGALRTLVCAVGVCCQKPNHIELKVFLRTLSFDNNVIFLKPGSLRRLNRIEPEGILEER